MRPTRPKDDPPTRFKGALGTRKIAAWTDPLPLADVKCVAKALGCTINDLLMSTAAGALGSYLREHGEDTDGMKIRATVPVNLRDPKAAASLGNEDIVRSLLEKGADPARPGPYGDPILLSYLRGGLAARAIEAIAKGADVNAKDATGRAALHLAVEKGMEDAAKALLDKGAEPNAADKDGLTGIEIAENWGRGTLLAGARHRRVPRRCRTLPVRARGHEL